MTNALKNKIRDNFDRAYCTYDEYGVVQKTVCRYTVSSLMKYRQNFKVVADFACGTGESTVELIRHIHYRQGYAVDFATRLLDIAALKMPMNVECIASDFDERIFSDNALDLVFCNMGLQWSVNLDKTLSLFRQYLCHSGWLVFSMPIQENFPEIKSQFKYELRSQDQILAALNRNRFCLIESNQYKKEQSFSSYHEALQSLQKTGVTNPVLWNEGFKKIKVRDFFMDDCSLAQLTYHVGVYVCQVR